MTSALHAKVLELAAQVRLPIDALMQPIALLGNRGGGKTYCGQSIFELAYDAGVQCIAIDVVGKWWALRMGKSGKAKGGLAGVYIFGGKHADFPITVDRGAFVARVIVENRIHAVLDLSLMRKADRRRFLVDFAEELFLLKKQEDAPQPCVLFLEEAHAVLPQKQRPATVNKNALALIEILIVLRITYKIDRDVIEDWVVQKGADQVKLGEDLPFLKAGHGYLYAPIYDLFSKVTINPKRTYDASRTAKIGEAQRVIGKLTPVDVAKVREAMAEVVASVDAKDPKKLLQRCLAAEKKLSDLGAATAKTSSSTPATKPAKRIEVQVVKEKVMKGLTSAGDRLQASIDQLAKVADRLREDIAGAREVYLRDQVKGPIVGLLPKTDWKAMPKVMISKQNLLNQSARPPKIAVQRIPATREAAQGDGTFVPAKGELKMLQVLASRAPATLTKPQLRTLAGVTDGTFRTYGPRLQRNGLIEINGDAYSITSEGAAVVGDVPAVQSPDEVLSNWKRQLSAGEGKILDLLKDGSHTREEIGRFSGFTDGTLRTYLPRLERLGLVKDLGDKVFQISEDLIG